MTPRVDSASPRASELAAAQRRLLETVCAGAEPSRGWVVQRRNVVFGMLSRLRRAHPLTCALLREENQKFLAREVVGVLPRYPRLSDSVRHVVEREGMAADVPALRLALRVEGLAARAHRAWLACRDDPRRFVP